MKKTFGIISMAIAAAMLASGSVWAQSPSPTPTPRPSMLGSKSAASLPPPSPAPSYIIGPEDILTVSVWNEKNVSGDMIVRPDGKVTLPGVGNDIMASGLTVDELKAKVVEELKTKYFESPDVSIQVREIRSRRVYITGAVNKPGVYALIGPMNVNQLITTAGGLLEFADKKNITLISATLKAKDGSAATFRINYEELRQGKNLAKNNMELRPGDQLIVK